MLEKLRTSLLLPSELSDTTTRYKQTLMSTGIISSDDNNPGGGDLIASESETPATVEPFVEKIVALLDEDQLRMANAMTAVRQNELVTELAKADAIRDDLFIGFRDLVDASKRRQQTEIQEAWQQVWPVIVSAGTRLYTLGYAAQSGRLEALIGKLDQSEYQTALGVMGLTDIYDELKMAQQDFAAMHDQRLSRELAQQYPSLRNAKAPMVKHLNGLLGALDILGETDPESYTPVIEKMNIITNDIMSIARARRTRKVEGGGTPPPEEAPAEDALAVS